MKCLLDIVPPSRQSHCLVVRDACGAVALRVADARITAAPFPEMRRETIVMNARIRARSGGLTVAR